ncbi:MAG TPA: anhydro-N-acetylmuramic acid kinase [Gemmatimonas sp.]|nr:anhydro-N-acetylmuramic acid kinase [Gemmatimonas sp.]
MILVGLMSGTSLDGISAAVARFSESEGTVRAELISFAHRPYAPDERARLERAMGQSTAQEFCRLHADLGEWLADAALLALADAGVPRDDVAAIASHGQTLWHEPGHSTWQVGDAARIAERTGCAVVSDFRARDVAAGGQGAPLVPMADALLFAHPTEFRALQNLGGIGNVAVVPPIEAMERARGQDPSALPLVRAFDTGPSVVVIDGVTRVLRPGWSYDRDGALAATGQAIPSVVDASLAHPYFAAEPPKSTGRELFSQSYIAGFIERCRAAGASDADIVATAVSFTARSIADQYARFLPEPVTEIVLAGGGAQNPVLVRDIRSELARAMPGARVLRFDDMFFDSEAKEAVAFALLGYLHLTHRPGNLPSATGARGPRQLGVLTPQTVRASQQPQHAGVRA